MSATRNAGAPIRTSPSFLLFTTSQLREPWMDLRLLGTSIKWSTSFTINSEKRLQCGRHYNGDRCFFFVVVVYFICCGGGFSS
eukprot:m.201921 g.201921  ORF g.201921 m.201921 type:complete len:83 (-) comp32807_c3_seq3:35-283(-)